MPTGPRCSGVAGSQSQELRLKADRQILNAVVLTPVFFPQPLVSRFLAESEGDTDSDQPRPQDPHTTSEGQGREVFPETTRRPPSGNKNSGSRGWGAVCAGTANGGRHRTAPQGGYTPTFYSGGQSCYMLAHGPEQQTPAVQLLTRTLQCESCCGCCVPSSEAIHHTAVGHHSGWSPRDWSPEGMPA